MQEHYARSAAQADLIRTEHARHAHLACDVPAWANITLCLYAARFPTVLCHLVQEYHMGFSYANKISSFSWRLQGPGTSVFFHESNAACGAFIAAGTPVGPTPNFDLYGPPLPSPPQALGSSKLSVERGYDKCSSDVRVFNSKLACVRPTDDEPLASALPLAYVGRFSGRDDQEWHGHDLHLLSPLGTSFHLHLPWAPVYAFL
jgi:hypothetical protein